MKKAIPFALLNLFICLSAHAQLEHKGWWTRQLFTYRSDYDPNGGGPDLSTTSGRFLTQPELGYALNKRCLIGLVTQYSHTFSRQKIAPTASGIIRSDDRFFGAGPLFRYFIPLGKRVALMPEVFYAYYSGEKATVFSNLGVEEKNSTRYNSNAAGSFVSLICFLTRDMALSLTVASLQYYGNKKGHTLLVDVNPQQWLLGVEFYFEKRKKQQQRE